MPDAGVEGMQQVLEDRSIYSINYQRDTKTQVRVVRPLSPISVKKNLL